MVEDIYFCRRVKLTSAAGGLDAHAFIVNRRHAIYVPKQPLDDMARIIATAEGGSGTNRAYPANTVTHLDQPGIAAGRPRQGAMVRAAAPVLLAAHG